MTKYKITWEEFYIGVVEAKDKEEAREKWADENFISKVNEGVNEASMTITELKEDK